MNFTNLCCTTRLVTGPLLIYAILFCTVALGQSNPSRTKGHFDLSFNAMLTDETSVALKYEARFGHELAVAYRFPGKLPISAGASMLSFGTAYNRTLKNTFRYKLVGVHGRYDARYRNLIVSPRLGLDYIIDADNRVQTPTGEWQSSDSDPKDGFRNPILRTGLDLAIDPKWEKVPLVFGVTAFTTLTNMRKNSSEPVLFWGYGAFGRVNLTRRKT